MRSLGLAVAGLFGGWLVAVALIGAYRASTLAATGTAGALPFALRFAPELLAVAAAVALPLLDARRRTRDPGRPR